MHPATELLGELSVAVRREAAAAVDRYGITPHAEEPAERLTEQARLEIPQGEIHRGDRARRDTGTPVVADGVHHRLPRLWYVERVGADDRRCEHLAHEHAGRGARVREAEAPDAAD